MRYSHILERMIPPFLQRSRWVARMDRHFYDVVAGTSISFGLRILGRVLSLAFTVLLARLLGADGAGAYYLAATVAAVAGVAGRLGLDNAAVRFTAANAAREEWDQVAGLYRRGLRIVVLASVGATLLLVLAAPWIARGAFSAPELTGPLRLMSLSIVPTSLLTFHSQCLRGMQKIRDALLAEVVGTPLVSLPLLAWLATSWGVLGAVGAHVVATVLALAWGVVLWRRATPHLKGARADFDRRVLMHTSLPLFGIAVTGLAMTWADTLLLGVWEANRAVGIYGVAVRLSALTGFVLVSVNTIAAPKFAALYAKKEHEQLRRLAQDSTALMIAFALPLLIVFLAVPGKVLGLFGAEFEAGAVALGILAVGQFVNVGTGSVGYLLIMCGYERTYQKIMVVFAGLNVGLNLLLIPRYGVEGAAVATAASLAGMNLAAAAMVYRKLSILTLPLARLGSWRRL